MKTLCLFTLSVIVAFYGAVNADACSCMGPGPVCSIQLGTSTIFRGTVVERTLIPNLTTAKRPDGTEVQLIGNGTYKVRLRVAETFSGKQEPEQIVYTAQQSSACGFPFEVGREYVVFTYEHDGGLWTGHCSRTALLEPGVENKDVMWMRAYAKAPSGSEIFGSVLLPRDAAKRTVPATLHLTGPENRDAETSSEGKYSFEKLRAGQYSLALQLPDGFATYRSTSNVTVADKGCAEVNWPATYEGRITGRVRDTQGMPVADLRLELTRPESTERYSEHQATTALDGSYVFEHLSPGDYLVSIRDAGFLTGESSSAIFYPHSDRQNARPVQLGPAATYDHVDFTLERLRKTLSVRIKVLQPDGSPASAGLYLFAFPNKSSGREPTRTGVTDEAGFATLPLFPGWEYAISVAPDRTHPGCGFRLLTITENTNSGTITIQQSDKCANK